VLEEEEEEEEEEECEAEEEEETEEDEQISSKQVIKAFANAVILRWIYTVFVLV